MPHINRSALLPFSAMQMYHLVHDVSAYPEFLPGCIGSYVLDSGPNLMTATINISKAGMSETFTTRNILSENSSIKMQLLNGPFRKLRGAWYFISLGAKSCRVELYLEFEISNKLIEVMLYQLLKPLAVNMVTVFSERARELYNILY
ncbi:SRPBCC family protein [Candidatus Profftia tarda]|uniref:Ribosome association toxin RatA n=1 Tax=Candidatus Profftia tarda TaxID=1177216 RepID=A0A8E4H4D9_9ENTR|nr:SRPBCC family protein [Candidatus Profftia tarda]CAD6510626.1 Ribosome association toxin RatA [Candidatus Profftia tarda]